MKYAFSLVMLVLFATSFGYESNVFADEPGWREETFCYASLGSGSKRHAKVNEIESEMNAWLLAHKGIEYTYTNVLFGKGDEVMFIIRYKNGENKHAYQVKLFYVIDMTSSDKLKATFAERKNWLASHHGIEYVSFSDTSQNGKLATAITYQATDGAPLMKCVMPDQCWREEYFYFPTIGSGSKRHKKMVEMETGLNAWFARNATIEYVDATALFGRNDEVLIIVRYKEGDNSQAYQAKLFYLPDMSSSTMRDDFTSERKAWLAQNPNLQYVNFSDRTNNGKLITVVTFQPTP